MWSALAFLSSSWASATCCCFSSICKGRGALSGLPLPLPLPGPAPGTHPQPASRSALKGPRHSAHPPSWCQRASLTSHCGGDRVRPGGPECITCPSETRPPAPPTSFLDCGPFHTAGHAGQPPSPGQHQFSGPPRGPCGELPHPCVPWTAGSASTSQGPGSGPMVAEEGHSSVVTGL